MRTLWSSPGAVICPCVISFTLFFFYFFLVSSVEILKNSGASFLAKRKSLLHCRSPAYALLRLVGGWPFQRLPAQWGATPLQSKWTQCTAHSPTAYPSAAGTCTHLLSSCGFLFLPLEGDMPLWMHSKTHNMTGDPRSDIEFVPFVTQEMFRRCHPVNFLNSRIQGVRDKVSTPNKWV